MTMIKTTRWTVGSRGALALAGLVVTLLAGLSAPPGRAQGPGSVDDLPLGSPPRGTVTPGVPVGTLGGSVSVGTSGGVGWSTALTVTAGPGGMQPGLSIGYSTGGYGGLGVGFSLGGVSSIARCAHTHGQDDRSEAITWTSADRLCLDGERLVAVDGGAHGADGTEYRLRSNATVRVIGRGASTHPLSGFTVYAPDGAISEYGVPSAGNWHLASVVANLPGGGAAPLVWSIHHALDRSGNRMDYHYAGTVTDAPGQLSPQDHRVARIEYGINATAGLGATREVTFLYATVPALVDPNVAVLPDTAVQRGYIAGVAFARTQVLTTIKHAVRLTDQAAWTPVRAYELQYEAVPTMTPGESVDQVRLAAMRQCDGQGACFPDTTFEWSMPTQQTFEPWPDHAFAGVPFYPPPAPADLGKYAYRRSAMQVMGDFDGDGVVDMLISPEWVKVADNDEPNGDYDRWELWQTKAGASEPLTTPIPAWSATQWVDRTGGVVVPGSLVQEAQAPRTGRDRDAKAVSGAWAVNVDGSYGTDVLIGRPQRELAGALMDSPWGLGRDTWQGRVMNVAAPAYCSGFYSLNHPGHTPEEIDKINAELNSECEAYLSKSPADFSGHPGIMAGFEVWHLTPGTEASFVKQDLNYPAGYPALWAQPVDLNADQLTDLVFCKANMNYEHYAGEAMPMYHLPSASSPPINWVRGRVHYAVNVPGVGLDLSAGGTPASDATGEAVRCHLKDALYVIDLHGDGRETVLHRASPEAQANTVEDIAVPVPAGVIQDPYPYDANDAELAHYNRKLDHKVRAEQFLGDTYYQALTWRWGQGLVRGETGLPYDHFMRWQGSGGNHSGRYSRYMPTRPTDVDAEASWSGAVGHRRIGWGTPEALDAGFGLGDARFADVNRDGLTDVLYVDLGTCYYATNQEGKYEHWPQYKARSCSFQDVMEFARDTLAQSFEKLTITIYLNRGDGTFDLSDQSWEPWDTNLYMPPCPPNVECKTFTEKQLGDVLYKGPATPEEHEAFPIAWTIATRATRRWRTEFASSQFGDGNGDGVADLAFLQMVFSPTINGWVGNSMAGTYRVKPQWQAGTLGGGFRIYARPMLHSQAAVQALPGYADGLPSWSSGENTLFATNGEFLSTSVYEQQAYGLPSRWQLGDFDRDGLSDLMLYDHVKGTWVFMRGTTPDVDAPVPQLLRSVTNGLGERTKIDYAPQHMLPVPGENWGDADLTLPYPLVSRPSTTLAVSTLHRDNGGDGKGEPLYNATRYVYGKSVSDVLRGVGLGVSARNIYQTVTTASGTVVNHRLERYDTAAAYDADLKAYALAGTLRSETSLVQGGADEPFHLSHTGYQYAATPGVKPGTWQRRLSASAATTYEVPGTDPVIAWQLIDCLPAAYDASQSCALGAQPAYQPLTHATRSLAYDPYGYVTTEVAASAGAITVSEQQLLHQDDLNAYALGLPTLAWVAHEPAPGHGYTVRTTGYSYYPDGRLKETTVEPDRVDYRHSTEVAYDVFGNVQTQSLKSDVGGWMPTTYSYSASGVYATAVTNEEGHTVTSGWTQPQHEACGVAERVTGVQGHTQITDIDTFCRTTGTATYYGAQSLGPKVSTSYAEWDPDGEESYPDVDILVTTQVAGGASSFVITDRLGRTVVSQGPGFGFDVYTRTRYDALGRPEAVSLPTKVGEQPAGWTKTRFDALGRAREVTAADGSTQSTRVDRYVSEVTDALGHTSRSTMNALGQVVRVDPPADPDQANMAMCYAYGAFGSLVKAQPCTATAHKAPVTLAYDDYGRQTQVTSAALGTRTTVYDQLGRVWLTTDAKGQQTRFAYDDLNRPISRTEGHGSPGAKTATWSYDTVLPGVLSAAVNADKTVIERPVYDSYRRPAGSEITIHGQTFQSRLAYDDRGRIQTTTLPSVDPDQAVTVSAQYNALDQLIGQSQGGELLWQPLEANVFGQMVHQRYGNGLHARAEHDPLTGGLDTATVLKSVTLDNQPTFVPIEQFSYDWHANGLLERRTLKGLLPNVADQSDSFYYSPRGELTAWTTLGAGGQAQSRTMTYDGFGNITQGPPGDYSYAGERLLTVTGNADQLSYSYDANGNVKVRTHNGAKTVIDYDAMNRVDGLQDGATQSTYAMTYNADGAKVHVREAASGRQTFYLGGYQRETGGKLGTQVVERINLGPAHLTRVWAGNVHEETRRYLTPADPLGSLTLITDTQGLISDRRSNGPWGEERDPANWIQAKAVPLDDTHGVAAGYTGHERKLFGALIDMRARYYDPIAQRMVQADTVIPSVFNPLAWNAYAYTYNSPVAYTDPSGHAPARELSDSEVADHLDNFVSGMSAVTNAYALANGGAGFSLSGASGWGNGLAAAALGVQKSVMAAAKLGKMMKADHEKQVANAREVSDGNVGVVAGFDAAWQSFVTRGMLPPFRTLEEYQRWEIERKKESAANGNLDTSMMRRVPAEAYAMFGRAVGAQGAGLRNVRMLPDENSGSATPSPASSTDDAMDAAAASGGPGGGWWGRVFNRKGAAPLPHAGQRAIGDFALSPAKVSLQRTHLVHEIKEMGNVMHGDSVVGSYVAVGGKLNIFVDAGIVSGMTARNSVELASALISRTGQINMQIKFPSTQSGAHQAAQSLAQDVRRFSLPANNYRAGAPIVSSPSVGMTWDNYVVTFSMSSSY